MLLDRYSIYSLLDVFPHSVILAASELKVECDFEHGGEEGRSFVAVAIALVSDLRRVHWLESATLPNVPHSTANVI